MIYTSQICSEQELKRNKSLQVMKNILSNGKSDSATFCKEACISSEDPTKLPLTKGKKQNIQKVFRTLTFSLISMCCFAICLSMAWHFY